MPRKHLGIHYVGTARQVRLPNYALTLKAKELEEKGRGNDDIRVEGNHSICAVKWYGTILKAHHHPLSRCLAKRQ